MNDFLEKFGCLTTIVIILGGFLLCKNIDGLCYITHNPIEYCRRFPSGRYQDKAIQRIINKLSTNSMYYYDEFGSQKQLASFITSLPSSPLKDTLETISRNKYEEIRNDALEIAFTTDFDWRYIENKVEDKYKPDLAAIRADLERRWQEESSAWAIVCNAKDKRRALEQFLEYFPNGKYALEANQLLVDILQGEVRMLEGELDESY